MIGQVIEVNSNNILVEKLDSVSGSNLINQYVVIDSNNKLLIGEIKDFISNNLGITLLGEIIDNKFVFGVINRPNVDSKVYLLSKDKIPMIISCPDYQDDRDLYLGMSPIYDTKVSVNINKFFSQHFAIFGSTGSGKSCGFARLIQNIFTKENPPKDMNLCIFDAYGEYNQSFGKMHEINPALNFKSYTTNLEKEDELIRIPVWLLTVDDLAELLGCEKAGQLLIIERALSLVRLFKSNSDSVIAFKNDIIARALLDVLSSGRPANQIRDQVFSVLSVYRTDELCLETEIYQPGYTRPLKQCLIIDRDGKIQEMELLIDFFNKFLIEMDDEYKVDEELVYGLNDLEDAFNFALVSEGVLKSDHVYDEYNQMRARMHNLANGDYRYYFKYDEYISKKDYVNSLLNPNGVKAQIVNFNINYVDDRFAKTIVKIYSKMFFDYSKELEKRGSNPIHILLEEAHRYVQNDSDTEVLGYNIFDRITKEGRKYGIILGLISQRPSELSETAISQCSNFIIFRTIHFRDLEYIRKMIPNITEEITKELKVLQPGNCLAFGSAFKLPVLVRLDMPNPTPSSDNVDISYNWFHKNNY